MVEIHKVEMGKVMEKFKQYQQEYSPTKYMRMYYTLYIITSNHGGINHI